MDTLEKFGLLTQYAGYEVDQLTSYPGIRPAENLPCEPAISSPASLKIPEITAAKKSNGGEIRLLKTVLTSACEKNCNYCAFRAGRDFRRASLQPDEMARTFQSMVVAGISEGLFLSSGISGGGIRSQDKLIAAAEILRKKHAYRGYLHLKIMPGAEQDQIVQTMRLASRVSVNLEGANQKRLEILAPKKLFESELMQPLRSAAAIRKDWLSDHPPGVQVPSIATQLVVGPAGETDLELLQLSQYLFKQLSLARVYYSAFTPVRGTPFETTPPESPLREFRLYQAGFLIRDYEFNYQDFILSPDGYLPLESDPKMLWAQRYLISSPIEINKADKTSLLHIPGIGPRAAKAILQSRKRAKFKELGDLRRLGIRVERAAPFILLDGRQPERQLRLWE